MTPARTPPAVYRPIQMKAARPAPAVYKPVQMKSAAPAPAIPRPVTRARATGHGAIQRAYIARRPLGGKPGSVSTAENPGNLGTYHEHLFFEDGQEPSNIGFFGDGRVRPDEPANLRFYTRLGGPMGAVYDDGAMRKAVREVRPCDYGLLSNNCQDWMSRVLARYNEIVKRWDPGHADKGKTHAPHWMEMRDLGEG